MKPPPRPALFEAIIENDDARQRMMRQTAFSRAEWLELKRLKRERRDFTLAAEKMLRWNPGGRKDMQTA